jgi:hypothetical protein
VRPEQRISSTERWARRVSVSARCVFAVALAVSSSLIGCAHGATALRPDPCVPITDGQLVELSEMVAIGVYPEVVSYVGEYEYHCCLDDALGTDDVSHCDDDRMAD